MVIAIILGVIVALATLIWGIMSVKRQQPKLTTPQDLDPTMKADVDHVFDDQFREEMRNRGRLYFEKIINENAMFLQQDLRLTTSQLNEFMKTEINKKLQEEFQKYQQSITDAKEIAVASIQKTNSVIDEQRQALSAQLSAQLEHEKENLISHFEEDMADIINHYVLGAIGNQIDLSDQLEYIMGELIANKKAIAEDIRHGA